MFAATAYDFYLMMYYILMVFIYFAFLFLVSRIEYHVNKKKYSLTHEICLERLAKKYGVSEFTLFLRAALNWNIPEKEAKSNFKSYLANGDIPYYVRDFVRQHKDEVDYADHPPIPFRNKQPPACPG